MCRKCLYLLHFQNKTRYKEMLFVFMQIPKESVSHVSVSSDNKQSIVKQICNKIIKGESVELLLSKTA